MMPPPLLRSAWRCLLLCPTLLVYVNTVSARFDYGVCCRTANSQRQLFLKRDQTELFEPLLRNYTTCGQEYDGDVSPAPNVYLPYRDCRRECRGIALSRASDPSTWAAPIVQFVLPSIIFSMSIPRRTLFVPSLNFRPSRLSSIVGATFGLMSCALDTFLWVAVILTLAGPLMVSGLTEALLDYRILAACCSTKYPTLNDSSRLRLITTVVCGNIQLQAHKQNQRRCPIICRHDMSQPAEEIPRALEAHKGPQLRQILLNLMTAQGDFGALVGAPVVFYMGGFVYTLLDLLTDPSAQAAAISLAFGVNWMMVVHVAIISGCLLASNNPSAVSGLAGWMSYQSSTQKWYHLPLVYETPFQPVSMWQRGENKKAWLASLTPADGDMKQIHVLDRIRKDVRIGFYGWIGWVFIPTVVLVSLPPAAGAFVAWKTPPIGWGCRSLTLVIYAACQLIMIVLQGICHLAQKVRRAFKWTKPFYSTGGNETETHLGQLLCLTECAFHLSLWLLRIVLCFLSAFTALGGTLMQITGIYGNCFCYVNSQMWFNLDEAYVNVASDTYDQRHSSKNWITMGSVATGFMVTCSYLGWWYQRRIRGEYRKRVEELDVGR